MRTGTSTFSLVLVVYLKCVVVKGAGPDKSLIKFLQPDDIDSGKYDNYTTEEAEKQGLCARPCENATRMVCYFYFALENYATVGPACGNCLNNTSSDCYKRDCVTADGVERPILTINRRLPGPSIQVCRGDTIVVDVNNKIVDRVVTLHWHGVYQRNTPHSDGVPMVTQCPIIPDTTWRYKFPAMPYGTFFFHSHQGFQKMDGLEGSLVIRRPKSKDPTGHTFDKDLPSHVIIVMDWLHAMTDAKFPGNRYFNVGTRTESFLINGRSSYVYPNGTRTKVPRTIFKVDPGFRYRFRLIGGSCLACPFLFIIEGHKMLLVAVDGTPVESSLFDSITVYPGDRMDFIINANQTVKNYWIQIKTLCTPNVSAQAILQYTGADSETLSSEPSFDAYPRGRSLNGLDDSDCSENAPNVCWNRITALTAPVDTKVLKPIPDRTLVYAMDEYHFDQSMLFWDDTERHYYRFFQSSPNVLKTHVVNNITFAMPPFPVLSQSDALPDDLICPTNLSKCGNDASQLPAGKTLCQCTDIINVKLNEVVTMVFVDWLGKKSIFEHPMHLHGTDMYIIDQGVIPIEEDDKHFINQLLEGLTNSTKIRPKPCVKDTVTIPPNGYVVVRTIFNNPGAWLLHCHFAFHTETGMNKVFMVGNRTDFIPTPPNFPTCNNYLPAVDPNEFDSIDWDDEPTVQSAPTPT